MSDVEERGLEVDEARNSLFTMAITAGLDYGSLYTTLDSNDTTLMLSNEN